MNHWNTIRQDGPHGVLRIYDPARFGTNKHNNPYQGNSWPGLTPVFPNQFPFPAPLYFNEGTALELKPLSESRFRTAARSRTSTASKITQLHTEGGQGDLQFVSMSDGLASRLAWYGEGRPQLPSTWPSNINPARRLPVAQAQQQIHAIYLLWAWFQGHSFPSRNRIVNGEPAVQDQVLQQLIEPLNIFLQVMAPLHHQTYIGLISYRSYQNWYQNRHVVNQNLHEHGYDKPAFYPLWRRAVPADHRERDHANAGFPDFFLTTEQERTGASSAAVIEVKTFWSFDAQDVWDIFSNRTIPNGIMSWEGDTPYSKILKQVHMLGT